jgi:Fanconi-associated nuclease 1
VEDLVLEHYALPQNGAWQGIHCESGVWATLFGLLLYPVLFTPVPDVFRSPFQSAPLDLGTDAFAPARAKALEATIARIRRGEALDMLNESWTAHRGALTFPACMPFLGHAISL